MDVTCVLWRTPLFWLLLAGFAHLCPLFVHILLLSKSKAGERSDQSCPPIATSKQFMATFGHTHRNAHRCVHPTGALPPFVQDTMSLAPPCASSIFSEHHLRFH